MEPFGSSVLYTHYIYYIIVINYSTSDSLGTHFAVLVLYGTDKPERRVHVEGDGSEETDIIQTAQDLALPQ